MYKRIKNKNSFQPYPNHIRYSKVSSQILRYHRGDNRYISPLSHGNDIKIDMLQGSIEYQRHKMRRGGWPQDFEDSARSSLIIVKFMLTRRVVYTLSSPVLRFKRTRSGGGLAIEKTGRGPRFLSLAICDGVGHVQPPSCHGT